MHGHVKEPEISKCQLNALLDMNEIKNELNV